MASPAVVAVYKCTGSSAGTETLVTTFAFKSVDDSTGAPTEGSDASNHPVDVPEAGTEYSYECWLRLGLLTAPDTQITNIKWWGINTQIVSGVTITDGTTNTGVTPVNTESAVGSRNDQHTTHYSEATALAIAGTLTASGNKSDYNVLQAEVSSSVADADIGNQGPITQYYSYQEN